MLFLESGEDRDSFKVDNDGGRLANDSTFSLGGVRLTSSARAEPVVLADAQMDEVCAGQVPQLVAGAQALLKTPAGQRLVTVIQAYGIFTLIREAAGDLKWVSTQLLDTTSSALKAYNQAGKNALAGFKMINDQIKSNNTKLNEIQEITNPVKEPNYKFSPFGNIHGFKVTGPGGQGYFY